MPLRCFRCGRTSHFANECFARSTVDGQPLGSYRHTKKQEQGTKRCGVYVLQWPDGRIYVGKSQDIDRRIRQHADEKGVQPRELPTLTQPIMSDLESWERNETLEQMQRHGTERVRGWMYTSAELSEEQLDSIDSQIAEKYDLCRLCGRSGHFANQCSSTGNNESLDHESEHDGSDDDSEESGQEEYKQNDSWDEYSDDISQ